MGEGRFQAAMYLRLSRDDRDLGMADKCGGIKNESNSIGSQRELIESFLGEQRDIVLYDIYADDGYSGSNYDRPEFRRMMGDICAGRVNCVIVKDLSRFGRDYIETGKYLERIFPSMGVRFIALTDHYDSLRTDTGERMIILPVKNFINDSYCRDISIKVKSQLDVKRRNGECIAPFAPYGYQKSCKDRHRLVADAYAAEIVRNIFAWKIEGLAVSAIANKLNAMGVLSPKGYKQATGSSYRGGFEGRGDFLWSSTAVKRILTNETYLGHLVQGRTQKISYKLKKSVEKPKEEWIRAKERHEPIITEDTFRVVQNLMKADGRVSPVTGECSFFTGLLFCGDCGEQMIRKNRCYVCSTTNRGEGCFGHRIEENVLEKLINECAAIYVNVVLDVERLFQKLQGAYVRLDALAGLCGEMERLRREEERYDLLSACLSHDEKAGTVTAKEAGRLREGFESKKEGIQRAKRAQAAVVEGLYQKGVASSQQLKELRDGGKVCRIDRPTLCSLVQRIQMQGNRRVTIIFDFQDPLRRVIH